MALTITLPPELEAKLRERAEAQKRVPEELVTEAVETMVAQKLPGDIFLEKLAEMRSRWPNIGPFTDKALQRATAYED